VTITREGPGTPLGVTEPMISQLVEAFYATVRRDPAIGPVFARAVPEEDWPGHIAKLCDFWSSVLLMSGRFHGSPMTTHIGLGDLRPTQFARWLHLFEQTARAEWPDAAADLVVAKSQMIARSLQLGIETDRERRAAPAAVRAA